jgi:site-specific DNA recombinase
MLSWSPTGQSRWREQTIKKLQARHGNIEMRIEGMYMDKLDGRIAQEFFDKKAAEWRGEQEALLRKIRDIQCAAPAPIDQAIDMLGLTSRASEPFLQQPAAEQRRLLQAMMEKAAWQGGELRMTLFEPFEILRHSNRESCRKENENVGSGRDFGTLAPQDRHRSEHANGEFRRSDFLRDVNQHGIFGDAFV